MKKALIFFIFHLSLFAATKYVTTSGQCAGPSLTYYTSIQSAITASSSGDTVSICPGTYSENNIGITKNNLTVKGYSGNRDDVLITKNGNSVFIIKASNATIKDLSIKSTSNSFYGITDNYQGSGSHTFDNLSISTKTDGIYLGQNSLNNAFSNLSITSTAGKGIALAYNASGNHTFQSVSIDADEDSINIAHSGDVILRDVNLTSSNGSGIIAKSGITLLENFNITAKTYGADITLSQNATIQKGSITTTTNNAINFVWGSAHAISITDTIISAGGRGINIPVASSAAINRVCISSATYGIYAEWNTLNLSVTNSKIGGNTNSGVYIASNPSYHAALTNNCFQTSPFAYRNNSAHTFNSNYWNGTAPLGYDSSPLGSCPISSCYTQQSAITPIADYRLDECSWNGTTGEVKDNSGNNLHGTVQGTAQTSTDSIINSSGVFDNSTSNNAAISIPDNDILSPHVGTNGEITISAWVKLNAYPTSALQGRIPIVAKGDNNNWEYALYIYQDHRAGFSVWQSSGSSYMEISGGDLALNTWYHITGVLKKGSFAQVYVNGSLVVESTSGFSGTTTNGTSPLYIARRGSGNNYLNGYIDEAKIFAKAFTQTEVQSVYNNEAIDKNYDGTTRELPCCCVPTGGNLIANPSFETLCQSTVIQTWNNVEGGTVNMRNNVCGWTMNGTGMETWENTTSKPASNGTVFVEIDGSSSTVDQLSQNLNTVSGVHYIISFDYKARFGGSDRIIAKWNGTEIGIFTGITTRWQTAQIEVVGTGSDILAFEEPTADNNSLGSWIDYIRVAEGTLATNCTSFTYEPYHSYNASLTPSYRLHTRISQQPFDLNVTVACAGSGTIPARKIKNIYAIDGLATSCNATTPKLFTLLSNGIYDINDMNKIINIPNLNITKAYSNIKLMLETNSSEFNCSSDNFVIRPPSFSITSPIPSTKATTFTLQISANNSGSGYNGTANVTTGLQVPNSNCPISSGFLTSSLGTIEPLILSFQNDSNSSLTKATDVGTIYLSTKSTTWTTIDQPNDCIADNNTTAINTQGFVGCNIENNLSLSITPDHFDVNATLSNFNGGTFTYLSTDLTMSGQLDLNITAKNGEGNTTKNYTAGCYSKDTTVTLPHSTVPSPLTKILYHDSLTLTDTNITKTDPITSTYNASKFNQGSVTPQITLNFDRSRSSAMNPFDFNITSATATDVDITGTTTPLGVAKFVYGRARAYDIATNVSPVDVPIEFEVYSTTSGGFVNGMPQNVLKWYRNLDHNSSAYGTVISGSYTAGGANMTTISSPQEGIQTITVTSTQDRTIHLDISPWLWYSLNPLKTYNYGTDCTQHPCFNYDYTDANAGVKGVSSGTFQGSDFQMAPAKNITNKGVKLFR